MDQVQPMEIGDTTSPQPLDTNANCLVDNKLSSLSQLIQCKKIDKKFSHASDFTNVKTLTKEEIFALGCSLKGFEGEESSLLTFMIHPQEKLARFGKIMSKELAGLQTMISSEDVNFRYKTVAWFFQKFQQGIEIPENGLAIFAGAIRSGLDNSNRRVISRVMIAFQPEHKIHSTTYMWDPKFHPELLIANLEMEPKFGIVIISPIQMTLCRLHEKKLEIEYLHYEADMTINENVELELKKLAKETGRWFTRGSKSDAKPIVNGIIIAFTSDVSLELSKKIKDPNKMFHHSLLRLMGKSIQVNQGGEDGLGQAIDATHKFRQEAWFIQQKHLIWKKCPVYFPDAKTPLQEHLKQLGLGVMESITELFYHVQIAPDRDEVRSAFVSKVYVNFENRAKFQKRT